MIDLKIDGPIATVTLCRPPVNAINDEWIARFDTVLDEITADAAVAVVWIRSSQKVFCAGADLAMMREILASAEGRARMIALTRRMQEVFERIETLPKTTLAEIRGPALGGGFELALSCDLRIVADQARVGLPEAALGLLPAGGGTQRMTRICGEAVARRLILGAETVSGVDAVKLGLAQWSVPGEELDAFAGATAARIAALPPRAIAECKACIDISAKGGTNGYEVELAGSGALLAMPETLARVARFLDGRR